MSLRKNFQGVIQQRMGGEYRYSLAAQLFGRGKEMVKLRRVGGFRQ